MRREYLREQLRALPLALVFVVAMVAFFYAPRVVSAIIAGALFLLAAGMVLDDWLLARKGQRVIGKVVDHKLEEGCFIPVVEFTDLTGVTRREAAKSGRGVKHPPAGMRVVVLFDPTGKRQCEIDTFFRRWGIAISLTLMGCVFAFGAVFGQ